MGVIAFARPQEGIDFYKGVLDFLDFVQVAIGNPEKTKQAVADLTKQVAESLELSDAKKKEAADAQEYIAVAAEMKAEFEKAKAAHDLKVKTELTNINAQYDNYRAAMEKWAKDKSDTLKSSADIKADAEFKLAQVMKLHAAAVERDEKAQRQEMEFAKKKAEYEEKIANFEKYRKDLMQDFDKQRQSHQNNVSAFELRKRAFEEALHKF